MVRCWRCQGSGKARSPLNAWAWAICPTCEGTGEPERLAQAQTIAEGLEALRELAQEDPAAYDVRVARLAWEGRIGS